MYTSSICNPVIGKATPPSHLAKHGFFPRGLFFPVRDPLPSIFFFHMTPFSRKPSKCAPRVPWAGS
jgi:hypothetical protein